MLPFFYGKKNQYIIQKILKNIEKPREKSYIFEFYQVPVYMSIVNNKIADKVVK